MFVKHQMGRPAHTLKYIYFILAAFIRETIHRAIFHSYGHVLLMRGSKTNSQHVDLDCFFSPDLKMITKLSQRAHVDKKGWKF